MHRLRHKNDERRRSHSRTQMITAGTKRAAQPLRRCRNRSDEGACSIVGSGSSCVQASLCQRTDNLAAESAGVVWHLNARRAVPVNDRAE
jgi:hypothetical protein